MMIGFFSSLQAFACKTEAEFDDLITKLKANLPPKPMFEICDSNPFDLQNKKVDHNEGKTIF